MAAATESLYPPLRGMPLVLASIATTTGTFMVSLDATIANVSLTSITGNLGATASQGSWIITSYGVANAIAMLLSGWLAKRVGQVHLYVAAVLGFTLASLLCSLATSLPILVAFRVLQGLSAGPMISLAMALNMQCYPPHKASQAIATQTVVAMAAPALGPIVGGWLTDNFAWPSIFLVNLPFGLIGAILAWEILRERESARVREPIDYTGLVLLVIWVAAMQTSLEQGRELDWFGSATIRLLAGTALVAFSFFVVWEWHERHPVVDLSLFRYRNFSIGLLTAALGNFLYFGTMVLTPLWLRETLGYTAGWAGLVLAPVGLTALLVNPFAGKLVTRVATRYMIIFACLLLAGVNFMRSGFTAEVSAGHIVWLHICQGFAIAFFFMPILVTMLSGIPQVRLPTATGLANFIRFTAGSIGTSAAVTVWDNRTSVHHARLVEYIHPYRTEGATDLPSLALMEREIMRQAETIAANEYFFVAAFLFLGLIAIIAFARAQSHLQAASAGGGGHE